MKRTSPGDDKKKKPQITQIFFVFLSCFSCVSWIIFTATLHDAAPSAGDDEKMKGRRVEVEKIKKITKYKIQVTNPMASM
jgi:hypothetical protein